VVGLMTFNKKLRELTIKGVFQMWGENVMKVIS